MTIKIILAVNHPIVRDGLRKLLAREADLQVVGECRDGRETLKLLQKLAPEVIILDIPLPDLNAIEATHQILAQCPGVKVIALSMHADRRFILEVFKAGAVGFVLKEHAFEELAVAIRSVQAQKTYISHSLFSIVIQDYVDLLRDSEAHFRTIFKSSPIGIALMDGEGRIVNSNPALQELLGYSEEELDHEVFSEFFKPEEAAQCQSFFKDLVAGNRGPYRIEVEYRRKDGSLSWGRLLVTSFPSADSEGPVAIMMLEDISDQKQAEAKIHHDREKLRFLAQELSLTEEAERRRLADGFHDDVWELLAMVQIKLGDLRQSIPADLTESLDEIRQFLGQIIRSTRSLVGELSPPVLYELGLESALEWLAEKIREHHGINITVAADPSPKPLSDKVRVFLFHLLRELLTNLVKRAKPNKVHIFISRTDEHMGLTLENDWEAESPLPASDDLLFFNLGERLRYLGGSLEVEFGPGQKTKMSLVVPLEEKPRKKRGPS